MKKIIALVLILVLTVSGCSLFGTQPSPSPSGTASPSPSPSPPPPVSPSPPPSPAAPTIAGYFPFTGNVRMAYQGTGNEFAAFESTVDYIGNNAIQLRTDNGGTVTVSVYTMENGALEKVFNQSETYFMEDFTARRTMSEILIKEPLAAGTTWTLEDGARRTITSVNAAVTVPYGSFTALEVTTEYAGSTTKDYYAAGFGLIKREFVSNEDPAFTVASELSEYAAGEPAVQTVRVYYPDYNNDRIAYTDQPFELYTNDTLIPKLENAFKNAPGSGLTAVMPADAVINGIAFDPANRVVTVDVSGAFITGMNAGASLEGMILESLADTIGGYYMTDKVQITVDGGPYESGHFLFGPGDYLPYRPENAAP